MKANSAPTNFSDDRQRDHLRQQERLKAMGASSEKAQTVSADVMIENLLKDSFKKLPEITTPVNHQFNNLNSDLPAWLQCDSAAVPPQYEYLWSLVQSTADLADTQKVSQLLLTSGLQIDVLGFIWNLANKIIPGQLTKQEFFIVLALVGLAQTGCRFNNLSIFKLVTGPSIPFLQVPVQKYQTTQAYSLQTTDTANINSPEESFGSLTFYSKPTNADDVKKDKGITKNAMGEQDLLNDYYKSSISLKENSETNLLEDNNSKTLDLHVIKETEGIYLKSNFPCIGSSPTAELEDDFSAFQSMSTQKPEHVRNANQPADSGDDFTEFQSAHVEQHGGAIDPFDTLIISQKKETPKISLPKTFTGSSINLKSNILRISPETEKKLKVLSAAESLSSLPESKISSSNEVLTSISVLGRNRGIGSRLANHSFYTKSEKPKCHKHHKIKINPLSPIHPATDGEILLGVKTRNFENVIPKCPPKTSTCKTLVLKETKIGSDESVESSLSVQFESEPGPSATHSIENTRRIEIPMLGTFNETVLPTQSKSQTSNFDLITVQEDKYSALREIELDFNDKKNSDLKNVHDDFGDFLSANIPDTAASEFSLGSVEIFHSSLDQPKNEEKSDWGDWSFNTEANLNLQSTSSFEVLKKNEIKDQVEDSACKNDLFDSLLLLNLDDKCNNVTSQPVLYSPEQQEFFGFDINEGNMEDPSSADEKDKNMNDFTSQSKPYEACNIHSNKEFQEFINTDVKASTLENFNVQESPPSLELKISPSSEQEIIWRKCLDSCHCLIQEGYDIFHSINTKSVLDEVFSVPKTEDYLNYLNIVFQISKRVSQNLNNFPSVQEKVEKLWDRLKDLCFEYNIKLRHDEDNCSEGKFQCNICLRHIGCNVINPGTSSYHASCANFWINCVEGTLPFSL